MEYQAKWLLASLHIRQALTNVPDYQFMFPSEVEYGRANTEMLGFGYTVGQLISYGKWCHETQILYNLHKNNPNFIPRKPNFVG